MPKYSKEMEAKIIERFKQGKRNSVISRELSIDRGALPSRRQKWEKGKQEQEKTELEQDENTQQEQSLETQKYTMANADKIVLSDIAQIRLKQIHALLGANRMDDMLETVFADYLVVDKLWLEYKEYTDVTKTFAWVIALEQGYAADLKHDLNVSDKGFQEDRKLIEELKVEAEKQYEAGYDDGMNEHALLVPCTICGQPITLEPGTESHQLISEVLREHGIVHTDCKPSYQRV